MLGRVNVQMRRLLVLFAAFVAQASLAVGSESRDLLWLVEQRVRIQSPVLGPGWHEGLFNRQRMEPPCYVIIIWKSRSSPGSPLQIEKTVELKVVSGLQAFTGSRTPVSTWAGRQSADSADSGHWQTIPPDVLNANMDCNVVPSSREK